MSTPTIIMFSKSDCPYCDKANAFFAQHGIVPIIEKRDDEDARNLEYDNLGLVGVARTMPQILLIVGDDRMHIGGWDKLSISGLPSLFMDIKTVKAPVAVSIAMDDVVAIDNDNGVCEACQ